MARREGRDGGVAGAVLLAASSGVVDPSAGSVAEGQGMTAKEKAAAKRLLERKAKEHDQFERDMLVLMRKFTDEELRAMGMAAGG